MSNYQAFYQGFIIFIFDCVIFIFLTDISSTEYVQTLGRPVGSYYGNGLFQQFKRKDGQLYNVSVLFNKTSFISGVKMSFCVSY